MRGCLIGCLTLVVFSFSGASVSLDNNLASARMNALSLAPSGTVTIVTIDAESISKAGEWPWPRERFAQALDNLNAAGAGMIALDVDFSARSSPEGDAALVQAVQDNAGWIALPAFLQRDYRQSNTPFGELAENAVIASVNVELSRDGRLRKYRRGFVHEGKYIPTLGGLLAGAEPSDTRAFMIDYGIDADQIDTISFDDVLHNRFDPKLIAGRSVVIGATALELGDLLSTPHSPAMPGVYVHALGYESLVQNRALTSPSKLPMLILGMALLMITSVVARHTPLRQLFGIHVLVMSSVLVIPFIIQNFFPISINTSSLIFALGWSSAAGIWNAFSRHKRALLEQESNYLTYMAEHDSETGMPNRRSMLAALTDLHRTDPEASILVVTFGIRRFGELRGAIGYTNAKTLIRSAAERLYETGTGLTHYHLGASVLGTLIRVGDQDSVDKCIDDVRSALQHTIVVAGQSLHIELSAGVAMIASKTDDEETALSRASLSLDHARRTRRDLVRWGEAQFEDPQLRLALLTEVNAGLDRDEFHLVYQPKICTRSHEIVGVEALMRWNHPAFGQIAPDSFITVAEKTGAIDKLTLWAIKQAIRDQSTMRRMGVDAAIAVNMSARSLLEIDFCRQLAETINQSGATIAIEITETAVMEQPELAICSANAFRDAGIKLAIDDYGAGQSSIAYLKRLPADELKLDRSMISDVRDSQRDRMILKSTFDLAHALGMRVVCEGVEDEATYDALKALGCDAIQGYLTGRPMAVDKLIAFSRSRRLPANHLLPEHSLAETGT